MKFLIALFFIYLNAQLLPLNFVLIQPKCTKDAPDAFYVSTTQVTQDLFYHVMGQNPSFSQGDSLPVESLSWYEAIVFCNKLSMMHFLDPVYVFDGSKNPDEWGPIPNHRLVFWQNIVADSTANGFRMITQKEWNYIYHQLRDELHTDIEEFAWVSSNSEGSTHIVGLKTPDKLGLYDFLGNILEWKFDYGGQIPRRYFNPINPETKQLYENLSYDILRSRDFMLVRCDSGLWPVQRNKRVGLRLVRNKY
jgi:formylglycine-generating enzyme required for sulfatase activity